MAARLLLGPVTEWFLAAPERLETLKHANERSSDVSLRLIDYFLVTYSRDRRVWWYGDDGLPFNVHQEYQSQLSAVTKNNFDPFRRGQCVTVGCTETVAAQMNCFRWLIKHRILDYIITHKDLIQEAMSQTDAAML
jgi:hypothetical protein